MTTTAFFSFLNYWKQSPEAYRKLVIGLLVFTLFNSSDVFLLLQIKQAGLNDTSLIGVYIFYNLIYALFAFPIGVMAAIYLNEYVKDGFVKRFIKLMTNNLAGIPSIVFGLFGMALFVNKLKF